MAISITISGDGLRRLTEATRGLSDRRARVAFSRALNHSGRAAGTQAGRALSDQTGLPKSTGRRAVRRHVERSTPATLSYTIHGRGGDVSLRYFRPRETKKGVTASPWGKRTLYAGSFLKAGWWPKRVVKPNWNRQVFIRSNTSGYGKARSPITGKLERSGTKFTKVKSGLFIPIEMVRGATANVWSNAARRLQPRVEHEVRRLTKGAVS